jgi:hypothetical protein
MESSESSRTAVPGDGDAGADGSGVADGPDGVDGSDGPALVATLGGEVAGNGVGPVAPHAAVATTTSVSKAARRPLMRARGA